MIGRAAQLSATEARVVRTPPRRPLTPLPRPPSLLSPFTSKATFSATRIGVCSNDCEVVARAQAYQPYRAPVSRHCTRAARGGCEQSEVNAKLKRMAD